MCVCVRASLQVNKWTHVALVTTENQMVMYKNGVKGQDYWESNSLPAGGTVLQFGCSNDGKNAFDGEICGVSFLSGFSVLLSPRAVIAR